MTNTNINWRVWVIGGGIFILGFVWASEVVDLPRFLLNAPATPVNWKESLIESVVSLIVIAISWNLIDRYEKRWLRAMEELRELAITDDLTGASNRRECMLRSDSEFQRSMRFNRPFSLAIIDFDNFKAVNDRFGHPEGDLVLQHFAEVVKNHIRTQDVFGRIGGDEFLLAFVETPEEEALQIVERIRAKWREDARPSNAHLTTFSVGISQTRPEDKSMDDFIRRVDKSLYMAKARGRNLVQKA